MVWCLTLIWRKFSVIIASDIALVPFSLSSPFAIPIMHLLYIFVVAPSFLAIIPFFFSLFLLCFFQFLLTYSQVQRFFFLSCVQSTNKPIKDILYFSNITFSNIFLIPRISIFIYITHLFFSSCQLSPPEPLAH